MKSKFAAALAGMLFCCLAHAQSYPSRPGRIVVPFPPGNASDLASRSISEALAKRLGQPVVIDNRPGAAGMIGADHVAKSAPDGYTLLGTSSAFSVTPAVYPKLQYDAEKDLVPLAPIGWTGMMRVAGREPPAGTEREIVSQRHETHATYDSEKI